MIYLELFLEFFKIGLFTFGGGYAMIPLLRETVLNHSWLSEEMFYDFIGVCEATPGPIAVNMATYVGATQAGFLGSIIATLGVVIPSFIIIVLIASILKRFIKNKYVIGFLDGVKPVILGLILSSGFILAMKAIGYVNLNTFNFSLEGIIIISILAIIMIVHKYILKKKFNTILFIFISAGVGILICSIIA